MSTYEGGLLVTKVSYDSDLGGPAIESVAADSKDANAKSRPMKPVFFSGDAARDAVQTPYSQFVTSIHAQLDEDAKIVDVLELMMKAVDKRIVGTDTQSVARGK